MPVPKAHCGFWLTRTHAIVDQSGVPAAPAHLCGLGSKKLGFYYDILIMARAKQLQGKARKQGYGQPQLKNRKGAAALNDDLPSDDEVEKFHKSRDKLSLNPSDDLAPEDESEDDLEDAVYNLSDDVGADSDEEDSDEDKDGRLAACEPPVALEGPVLDCHMSSTVFEAQQQSAASTSCHLSTM